MMQLWYKDMVRFMRDASEYGTYNQELSKLLSPYLTKDMRICDCGSGLGYLSLALAPYVGHITSVEMNPDAAAVLRENCRRFGIDNVTSVCSVLQDAVPEEKYDAMVYCFFGGIHEILATAKEQCQGTVFIVTRNYCTHRFSVGSHPTGSYGYRRASDVLTEMGIPFERQILDLEFGQPFRCLEDARLFYQAYSQDEDKSVITDEFLAEKLVQTGREDFPLYMPHQRKLAVIKFETSDIPEDYK